MSPLIPCARGRKYSISAPKNLDIYVDDLPKRMAQLAEQGMVFRNEKDSEAVSLDGVHFRKIHLAGHYNINIAFLEVIGGEEHIPAKLICGVGASVCIVQDPAAENASVRRFRACLSFIIISEMGLRSKR